MDAMSAHLHAGLHELALRAKGLPGLPACPSTAA